MVARSDELITSGFGAGMVPDVILPVSKWADRYRFLSPVASAEPGPYRTDRTPYAREPMDCLSLHSPWERTVLQWAAQLGKTEIGNNWTGSVIHLTPGPMLIVEPTVDMVRKVSKQRIAPMIETTPVLRALVRESRSRDSGNTITQKDFPGGTLLMTGANSASGLRAMPIRYLFMDEVDAYPGDVDGEGSPVDLAEKRTTTFARRKMLYTSTPTIRGLSLIESLYARSDQRRYYVPCMHCGHMDWIQWRSGGYYGNEGVHHSIYFADRDPSTAAMLCNVCGCLTDEGHKSAMLERGEWRATAPGDGRTAGFHLSALYSPLGWKSWAQCVHDFLHSKDDPSKLKVFVTTVLGETWEESGDSVSAGTLAARLEDYGADVPNGAGVLVASVDVQGDRLEAKVKGYGAGEESWLVAFTQILRDPATLAAWHELDGFLQQPFLHVSGRRCYVECVTVDSGGLHTEHVYRYCKARLAQGRRVYPVKGDTTHGKPLVARPSIHNRYRVPLFMLCVNTGKELVMSRLQVAAHGPGYMHMPSAVADQEYLEQLTAEKAVRKHMPGKGTVKVWVKVRDRNEALDLEVYAMAALHILGQKLISRLDERAKQWSMVQPGGGPDGAPAAAQVAVDVPADSTTVKQILRRAGHKPGNPWLRGW